MAEFKKRSFWFMSAMTFVTICLYPFAWVVDTARELRAAGGKVPKTIFYFLPILIALGAGITLFLIYSFKLAGDTDILTAFKEWRWLWLYRFIMAALPIYFWCGYVRSYCQIVLHTPASKTFWTYFILIILGDNIYLLTSLISYITGYITVLAPLNSYINAMATGNPVLYHILSFIVVGVILKNIFIFFVFQRGFNKYESA